MNPLRRPAAAARREGSPATGFDGSTPAEVDPGIGGGGGLSYEVDGSLRAGGGAAAGHGAAAGQGAGGGVTDAGRPRCSAGEERGRGVAELLGGCPNRVPA